MLYEFVHSVRIGDIVVTPHKAERRIHFGRVIGDYVYLDPSPVPDLRHLRDVEWWGSCNRDKDIGADRRADLDRPPTLYALSDQAHWIGRALRAKSRGGGPS